MSSSADHDSPRIQRTPNICKCDNGTVDTIVIKTKDSKLTSNATEYKISSVHRLVWTIAKNYIPWTKTHADAIERLYTLDLCSFRAQIGKQSTGSRTSSSYATFEFAVIFSIFRWFPFLKLRLTSNLLLLLMGSSRLQFSAETEPRFLSRFHALRSS